MTKEVTTLYLEDVDSSVVKKRPRLESEEVEEGGRSPKPCVREKRQRTLFDMLPGSQGREEVKSSSASDLKPVSCDPPTLSVNVNENASRPDQSASATAAIKLNAIPFSLSAYQESLSEKERSLLRLECQAMGKSWLKVLKDEIRRPYFIALKEFLSKEGVRGIDDTSPMLGVYPPPKDIYSWSNTTPLGKVKVVILGQDPYHGRGQAHGLCFSVPAGVAIPPSLRNIYAEIKSEYLAFNIPHHGNLLGWANNGVLLLNSCLTVRDGEPNSHANKGWEQFTDCVLSMVDKYGGANLPSGSTSGGTSGFGRGVVFMAWGAYAAKRVAKLDKNKHLILTSAHPSPFSANKGFLGNGHFKIANQWLAKRYGVESRVDWCSLN